MTLTALLLVIITFLLASILWEAIHIASRLDASWHMLSDIQIELSLVSVNLSIIKDKLVPEHEEKVQEYQAQKNG